MHKSVNSQNFLKFIYKLFIKTLQFLTKTNGPVGSYLVDRASAFELADPGSIPNHVKPNSLIGILSFRALCHV